MPNLKKKTVIRTYYSKKTGGYVTKRYEYEASTYAKGEKYATKGYNLITKSKSGKISIRRKNVERLKDEIMGDPTLSTQEKTVGIELLEGRIRQRAMEGKTLTSTGAIGLLYKTDPIERFFANMGRTVEQAALELGVNESDLLNGSNWTWSGTGGSGVYNDPITGLAYVIDFTYEGNLTFRV